LNLDFWFLIEEKMEKWAELITDLHGSEGKEVGRETQKRYGFPVAVVQND
jgi:hypothetical protein